jgi:two-component system nitrate/nitrite response regulator NarL
MELRAARSPTAAAPGPDHDAIRVIIATRAALYREGLAEALRAKPRVAVAGTACSCGELAAVVPDAAADAVLLDTELDGAIPTAGRLAARCPDLKIVALGAFTEEVDVIAWAEAGVAAFVTQMDGLDSLVATLESVVEGRVVCTPLIAAALLRRVKAAAAEALPAVGPAPLTLRELDVLKLVDEGLSNKEIAGRLGIKLATVKNHVHNILEKLDVERRTEAVFHVRRLGLLTAPAPASLPARPAGRGV